MNAKNKKILAQHRSRAATIWNGEADWSGDFEHHVGESIRQENPERDLAIQDAINHIRNETRADASLSVARQREDNYIRRSSETLENLFRDVQGPNVTEASHPVHVAPSIELNTMVARLREEVQEEVEIENFQPLPEQTTGQGAIGGVRQNVTDLPNIETGPLQELLNVQQKSVFKAVLDHINDVRAFQNDPARHANPEQLLLMMHGGPGTGKTFTIEK